MTVERMIELLKIEKECVLRNASGECNRYCAGCDLLQDDTELHEMYTEVIALLKVQEPVKPYAMYSEHMGTKWLVCGACNEPMNKTKDETWANFCPNCGRAVKYDV